MKLTENLEKCPNCGKLFYKLLATRAELHGMLLETESRYVYCSEPCLIKKLENMNTNTPEIFRVRIKNQSRIPADHNNPVIYRITFAQEIIRVK